VSKHEDLHDMHCLSDMVGPSLYKLCSIFCLGDPINECERGGACCVWQRQNMQTGFWWGNLMERELGLCVRIM